MAIHYKRSLTKLGDMAVEQSRKHIGIDEDWILSVKVFQVPESVGRVRKFRRNFFKAHVIEIYAPAGVQILVGLHFALAFFAQTSKRLRHKHDSATNGVQPIAEIKLTIVNRKKSSAELKAVSSSSRPPERFVWTLDP